ncbi:hypothetical protein Q3G72_005625 [Acer saccharum]|nr:hypothetical protein Q3G72_005625 [Acer saccharum]
MVHRWFKSLFPPFAASLHTYSGGATSSPKSNGRMVVGLLRSQEGKRFVLRLLLKLLVEVVTTHSLAATIVVNDGDNLSIKRLLSTQSLLWREIDCKWRQKKTLKNC